MTKPHGFTLVELMVVVAISVILLALAVPSFNGMIARQRVKGVATELVTNLEYARTTAAQRHQFVEVHFKNTADGSCYAISVRGVLGACSCGPNVCRPAATGLMWVDVPQSSGVNVSLINNPYQRIAFSPDNGIEDDRISASVNVVGRNAGKLRAIVSLAGRIALCSPDGSISGYATCP